VPIDYRTDAPVTPAQLADLFTRSGIRRPTGDLPRLGRMLTHASLLVTAWDGDRLIGVARSLTDFSYCCYLSDLAVDREYQKAGVGGRLVELTRDAIGDDCMLLLLSAPEAMGYYPKLGMEPVSNGWIFHRKQ
jgi:GNAT superfamily N-acetyltransferase